MDILHKRILYPPGCSAKHLCTDCLYFAAPCLGTQELLFCNFCHFCTESILRSQHHLTLHSHRDFSHLRHLTIIKIIIMMMQCCPTDQLTRLNKMQIKSPLRRHCGCISTQKAGRGSYRAISKRKMFDVSLNYPWAPWQMPSDNPIFWTNLLPDYHKYWCAKKNTNLSIAVLRFPQMLRVVLQDPW